MLRTSVVALDLSSGEFEVIGHSHPRRWVVPPTKEQNRVPSWCRQPFWRVECEPAWGTHQQHQPCDANWGPGDWSIDYYGPNRPVYFVMPANSGSGYGRVWALAPTCSGDTGGANAGWSVFIDLYANGGFQGWEVYSHVDRVQATPGTQLTFARVIGYTKQWPPSDDCYEVYNADGVHVHHEEWNYTAYACYWSYNSGTYLNYNQNFGTVGRTIYTAPRQPC